MILKLTLIKQCVIPCFDPQNSSRQLLNYVSFYYFLLLLTSFVVIDCHLSLAIKGYNIYYIKLKNIYSKTFPFEMKVNRFSKKTSSFFIIISVFEDVSEVQSEVG